MAIFSIPNVIIRGISACVPAYEYDNRSYDWISEKERSLLIKTIGVEKKRQVEKGVISSDLCYEAAKKLIDELVWEKEEIQILIFVSQTRDYLMPATSGILQDRLGLPKTCMALDVDMGCSGYVYGLSVISSLISAGKIKKALLLAGEVPTPNISYEDKSTFPLFGDAGTATALEYEENNNSFVFNLQSDGKGHKAIMIPDGGMRNYIDPENTFKQIKYAEGIIRNKAQISLDGLEVFNFTLREVAVNVRKTLKENSMSIEDIDYFVFHQANKLMNETIRKQLKIPVEKFPYSINKFGNTSSASIPLTIISELKNEVQSKKLNFLFSGFGVGLSWGSVILQTDKILCPEIIEI